jgi:hypothetical protein
MQKIIFISFVLINSFLFSAITLEEYARELPLASKPGSYIRNFVNSVNKNIATDKRLAILYFKLLNQWKYISDPPGYDHFSISEYLLRRDKLEGDCEDLASVIASFCKVMKIKCQIALGVSQENTGHAWTEVFISKDKKLDFYLHKRLKNNFGDSVRFVKRSDGFWLQMNPLNTLKKYKTTHIITMKGELIKIKHIK